MQKAFYFSLAVAVLVMAWHGGARAQLQGMREGQSSNMTRAPYACAGSACTTKLAGTTSTDADSGALVNESFYTLTCRGDSWVTFSAAADTAVADDMFLPAGMAYGFFTGGPDAVLHVSVLSVTSNNDCYLQQHK